MDNILWEETQLKRLLRQPNKGRRDGESAQSWLNRAQYAAMDTGKKGRSVGRSATWCGDAH